MKCKPQQSKKSTNSNSKMSILDRKPQQSSFSRTEHQIHSACDQMSLLLRAIQDVQVRAQRATKRQQDFTAKSLEMRVQVLQGVYNMYYEFCRQKADLLVQLEEQQSEVIPDDLLLQD